MSRDRQADDDIREGRYVRFVDDGAFLASLVAPEDPEAAGGVSAEDTCKPGDPDPTPEEGDCPASWADGQPGWPWECTRKREHAGQHVAGAGSQVAAVWS